MEKNQLVFNATFSVEEFKSTRPGAVLQTGHVEGRSGKCLLLNGQVIGAVSTKISAGDRVVISNVTGEEGDFFLLHKMGGGGMIIDEEL